MHETAARESAASAIPPMVVIMPSAMAAVTTSPVRTVPALAHNLMKVVGGDHAVTKARACRRVRAYGDRFWWSASRSANQPPSRVASSTEAYQLSEGLADHRKPARTRSTEARWVSRMAPLAMPSLSFAAGRDDRTPIPFCRAPASSHAGPGSTAAAMAAKTAHLSVSDIAKSAGHAARANPES
jgi:hypothetical protein